VVDNKGTKPGGMYIDVGTKYHIIKPSSIYIYATPKTQKRKAKRERKVTL